MVVRYRFFFIDSWDSVDYLSVYVDDQNIDLVVPSESTTGDLGKICGGKWKEKVRDYKYLVAHNSNEFKFLLTWIID